MNKNDQRLAPTPNTMAHKSNGYVYTDDAVPSLIRNGALTFYNRLEHHAEQASTLVMHGGKEHEPVYTASEVRAMLEAVKSIVDTSPAQSASSLIDTYLLKWHGITLDPA